tara:strand:- start:1326 stop:1628 length:303 start_codon:yes stop_codon:yes gene_type:complete
MDSLQQRTGTAAGLRLQAEQLIKDPAFSIEQLEQLLQQLQLLLQQPPLQPTADYAAFLQLNLDWLQALMAQLTAHKEAIAADMLELQKGKRAKRSYSQNN